MKTKEWKIQDIRIWLFFSKKWDVTDEMLIYAVYAMQKADIQVPWKLNAFGQIKAAEIFNLM